MRAAFRGRPDHGATVPRCTRIPLPMPMPAQRPGGSMAGKGLGKVEVRESPGKGRGLFAACPIAEDEVILIETPLVCTQFAWNAAYKYTACSHCMRSLEPAQDMARRLSNIPDLEVLHPECCEVDPTQHTRCPHCQAPYCSASCREKAWTQYHRKLCTRGDEAHPVARLIDVWRGYHYPPETTSIMLVARILATMVSAEDSAVAEQFDSFCRESVTCIGDRAYEHKLLEDRFQPQIDLMLGLTREFFEADRENLDRIDKWLSPDGFRSLLALIGTNGAGVGTSSISAYDKALTAMDLPPEERLQIDSALDELYEVMQEESGGFLDCEGSGLFATHSHCNHSCRPQAETQFSHGDHTLSLVALDDIAAGEEIFISYIDEPLLGKSKRFRQTYLSDNYLFTCSCSKCEEQTGHSDSEDEEGSSYYGSASASDADPETDDDGDSQ